MFPDGQPLFLVTLVQALVERGVLYEHDRYWTAPEGLDALTLKVPESLRQLLEQQITRLAPEAQRVLEVASVASVEFGAAAVAAALETDGTTVEEACEALVAQQMLRFLEVTTWPDGTITTRYAFVHALYQQVVYERLGAARRVRLHQRLGECLEKAYEEHAGEIAAELAVHFEYGRDYQRAVPYLQQAADNARRRCANAEAIRLLSKGLELLTGLPDTPERARHELLLYSTLGPVLIATRGYATPDVAHAYARARDLGQRLGDTPQLFVALRGLHLFHVVRAELQTASELADELLLLAQRQHDPTLLVFAHLARGIILFHSGAFGQARVHLEQGMALNVPSSQHAQTFLNGNDAVLVCISWVALTCGCSVIRSRRSREAARLSHARGSPPSRSAWPLLWTGWLGSISCAASREPPKTKRRPRWRCVRSRGLPNSWRSDVCCAAGRSPHSTREKMVSPTSTRGWLPMRLRGPQ